MQEIEIIASNQSAQEETNDNSMQEIIHGRDVTVVQTWSSQHYKGVLTLLLQ